MAGRPADWSRRALQSIGATQVVPAAGAASSGGAPLPPDYGGGGFALDPMEQLRVNEEQQFALDEIERQRQTQERRAKRRAMQEAIEDATLAKQYNAVLGGGNEQQTQGIAQMMTALLEQSAADRKVFMEALLAQQRQPQTSPELVSAITGLRDMVNRLDKPAPPQADPIEQFTKMASAMVNMRTAMDAALPQPAPAVPAAPIPDPMAMLEEQTKQLQIQTVGQVRQIEAQAVLEEAQAKHNAVKLKAQSDMQRTETIAKTLGETLGPIAAALGSNGVDGLMKRITGQPGGAPNGNQGALQQAQQQGPTAAQAGGNETETWTCPNPQCGIVNTVALVNGQPPAMATCSSCGNAVQF